MTAPVVKVYQDALYHILYLDGIGVSSDTYEVSGDYLNSFELEGTQGDPEGGKRMKPSFDPDQTYYMKERIYIDVRYHVMVSKNHDFSDWILLSRPVAANLIGALNESKANG